MDLMVYFWQSVYLQLRSARRSSYLARKHKKRLKTTLLTSLVVRVPKGVSSPRCEPKRLAGHEFVPMVTFAGTARHGPTLPSLSAWHRPSTVKTLPPDTPRVAFRVLPRPFLLTNNKKHVPVATKSQIYDCQK